MDTLPHHAMVDHAALVPVGPARLPKRYETPKAASATCARIDECKEWGRANGGAHLLRRQASGNETLYKTAMSTRVRASRLTGELLKQIKAAAG